MDRRLALRMIFLLVAALLGALLFVFHVRDMENRRLRRDLQGLADSLAIMIGSGARCSAAGSTGGVRGCRVRPDSRAASCRQVDLRGPLPGLHPGAPRGQVRCLGELGE